MPHRIRPFAAMLALSLLVIACADDDDQTATERPPTGSEAAAFELGEPMKLVLLADKKGDSPAAVANHFDGATMAVEDLNRDDGVGGEAVELVQVPTTAERVRAEAGLQHGVAEDPTAIIAFPDSSHAVALGPKVDDAGIPTIYLSAPPEAFRGEPAGSRWAFVIRPRRAGIAGEIVRYAVEELGAQRLGLICANSPFGAASCDEAESALQDLDASVFAKTTNEANASDLSAQVTAMRGADAVIDFNFPAPLGVAANQLIDNGVELPHLDGASAQAAVDSGAVRGPAAESLYGVADCVPLEDDRGDVEDWVDRYQERFGYAPNYASAEAYDAVRILAEAVGETKSTEPAAVADALRGLEHEGICDATYAADEGQGLHHLSYIITFTAEGEAKVEKQFDVLAPE